MTPHTQANLRPRASPPAAGRRRRRAGQGGGHLLGRPGRQTAGVERQDCQEVAPAGASVPAAALPVRVGGEHDRGECALFL